MPRPYTYADVQISAAGATHERSAGSVWSAHADYCLAAGRDEPAGPGDGRPDPLPDPHAPPRGPELPGGAGPGPGPDPVERVEPPHLSAGLRHRRGRARRAPDAV